eukprot:GHVU01098221.1.p1 GENE.GHVU01098221.1~~GHVU01098221.1.p1  ORF type:complete len:329 (+),score=61.02 GHVU01098221.1:902-1888(+)
MWGADLFEMFIMLRYVICRPCSPGRRLPTTNDRDSVICLQYALERCCSSMDRERNIEQFVFIVVFDGYTATSQPSLSLAKNFLRIFSCHYPERLYHAFLVDAPWYFRGFWNMVVSLIPDDTQSKVSFVTTTVPDELNAFTARVPGVVLPENTSAVGGSTSAAAAADASTPAASSDPPTAIASAEDSTKAGAARSGSTASLLPPLGHYNHEKYWRAEKADYSGFVKAMAKKFSKQGQYEAAAQKEEEEEREREAKRKAEAATKEEDDYSQSEMEEMEEELSSHLHLKHGKGQDGRAEGDKGPEEEEVNGTEAAAKATCEDEDKELNEAV